MPPAQVEVPLYVKWGSPVVPGGRPRPAAPGLPQRGAASGRALGPRGARAARRSLKPGPMPLLRHSARRRGCAGRALRPPPGWSPARQHLFAAAGRTPAPDAAASPAARRPCSAHGPPPSRCTTPDPSLGRLKFSPAFWFFKKILLLLIFFGGGPGGGDSSPPPS